MYFCTLKHSFADLPIIRGSWNFSWYHIGTAPVAMIVQHDGEKTPDEIIPDRVEGCSNETHCFWWHTCEADTGFDRDSGDCGITTSTDTYTMELAQCLREELTFNVSINGSNTTQVLYPHLIVSELDREKLDPNREIGEATLNNSYAKTVYNEIHYQFMKWAKENMTELLSRLRPFDHDHLSNTTSHLSTPLKSTHKN